MAEPSPRSRPLGAPGLKLTPPKPKLTPDKPSPRRGPLSIEEVRSKIEEVKNKARRSGAGTDQKLFENLIEDVLVCRKAGRLETALSRSYDTVACVEMNRKTIGEEQREVHAIAVCNLASTLHMLGHLAAARHLYQQAHSELAIAPSAGGLLCCIIGNLRQVQLDYIASRAEMAAEGLVPNARAYLDGDGARIPPVASRRMAAARVPTFPAQKWLSRCPPSESRRA